MPQPTNSQLFGLTIPHSESLFYPNGAGIDLGLFVFSTAHATLAYIYWSACLGYALFTYSQLNVVIKTRDAKFIRFGLIFAFGISFIWVITLFPYLNVFGDLTGLIAIAYVIEGVLAMFFPTTFLLSHNQLTKSFELVDNSYIIFGNNDNNSKNSLIHYLSNLPQAQLERIFADKKERPHSFVIIKENSVLLAFNFTDRIKQTGLVANLMSALFSFSKEIIKSKHDPINRFQLAEFKIIIIPKGKLLFCYMYEGFDISAELHLEKLLNSIRPVTEKYDEKTVMVPQSEIDFLKETINEILHVEVSTTF